MVLFVLADGVTGVLDDETQPRALVDERAEAARTDELLDLADDLGIERDGLLDLLSQAPPGSRARRKKLCSSVGPHATMSRMREKATLRLDAGDQVRLEVDRLDLDRDEIVVRRAASDKRSGPVWLIDVIDEHLASATPRAAGDTDRLQRGDRDRSY